MAVDNIARILALASGNGGGGGGESDNLWKPVVTTTGNISWVKSTSTTPPTSQNIKGEKGDKGDPGDRGPDGIQGIQGIQGPKGDPGDRGVNWRGPYQLGNTYNINDVVIGTDGKEYIALVNGVVLPPPSAGWDVFLEGIMGPQGIQGPQGPAGDQGIQGPEGPQGPKGEPGDAGFTVIYDNSEENPFVIGEAKIGLYSFVNSATSDYTATVYIKGFSDKTTSVARAMDSTSYIHVYKEAIKGGAKLDIAVLYRYSSNDVTRISYSTSSPSGLIFGSTQVNVDLDSIQTISNVKLFSKLPETSVVPTKDAQFVNKKYVDGLTGGIEEAPTDDIGYIRANGQWNGHIYDANTWLMYYVDSEDGDDNNDGLSPTTAKKSLQPVIEKICQSHIGTGQDWTGIYLKGNFTGRYYISKAPGQFEISPMNYGESYHIDELLTFDSTVRVFGADIDIISAWGSMETEVNNSTFCRISIGPSGFMRTSNCKLKTAIVYGSPYMPSVTAMQNAMIHVDKLDLDGGNYDGILQVQHGGRILLKCDAYPNGKTIYNGTINNNIGQISFGGTIEAEESFAQQLRMLDGPGVLNFGSEVKTLTDNLVSSLTYGSSIIPPSDGKFYAMKNGEWTDITSAIMVESVIENKEE